jgi:hypothetical protein
MDTLTPGRRRGKSTLLHEIVAHRKLLKREMQRCVKAMRCTSQGQRLVARWKRKYSPEVYAELMRIARNPAERRAVAAWIIIEPKAVRKLSKR